ncbi:unnamed protein product [Cochlearia groenlandica]
MEKHGGRLKSSLNGHLSVSGTIQRIRLENFMCHSNLEIEFCEWVNFISGQNGRFHTLTGFLLQLGLKEIEKELQSAETEKNHYENVMKDNVLPEIKVGEGKYEELETKRKVFCKVAVDSGWKKLGRNKALLPRRLTWELRCLKMQQAALFEDTRGLSGGERSFSTLCLALHNMTEAPD